MPGHKLCRAGKQQPAGWEAGLSPWVGCDKCPVVSMRSSSAMSPTTVVSHAVLAGDVPWDAFQKFPPVMCLEGAGFGSKEQQHRYCYLP